jgi:phospholipase C
LEIHNRGREIHHLRILDAYTKQTTERRLKQGENLREFWRLEATFGWYDFAIEADSDSTFRQRLAGHLETGRDSMSDPAIAVAQPV